MLSALLATLLQSGTPLPALQPTPVPAPAARQWPISEGDYVVRNFRFHDGETLPEIRLHYTTLGKPHRNAAGEIDNAVMILHGTGGTGKQFLVPQFANELYQPGQPLDITRYWIILPDNIGHGGSSKPSDGLRMRFPKYDYADMVRLQHELVTKKLGLTHLRLIFGTSMGCMHIFMWGEMYPDFPKALMPMACEPIEIAGLNRMWRQMLIDGIENDPAWQGGNYTQQPQQGLRTAASMLVIAGSAPLNYQALYPTRQQATAFVQDKVAAYMKSMDADDTIYQFDSSRNYNPWPDLEKITAPMTWINSADDFINPRNFPYSKIAVQRMKHAQFRLVPETANTHGHGTHTWAVNWKDDMTALLARSADK